MVGFGRNLGRTGFLLFKLLICPRHKEEVPRPRHDCACARKEHIGEGVAHRTDAQLVARVVFFEKIDDVEHLATLTF
ncbi:MAG: hypothetical protein WBW84_14035 [Acidobacteriaceae bacterium]